MFDDKYVLVGEDTDEPLAETEYDLIAVSILRRRGVIEKIKEGDIEAGVSEASRQ